MLDKIKWRYFAKSDIKKKFDDTYNKFWVVKDYEGIGQVLHSIEFIAVLLGLFFVLLGVILKAAKIPDKLIFGIVIAGIVIFIIELVIARMRMSFSDYYDRVVENVEKVMERLFHGYEKMAIAERDAILKGMLIEYGNAPCIKLEKLIRKTVGNLFFIETVLYSIIVSTVKWSDASLKQIIGWLLINIALYWCMDYFKNDEANRINGYMYAIVKYRECLLSESVKQNVAKEIEK